MTEPPGGHEPRGSVHHTEPLVLAVAGLLGAGTAWLGISTLEQFAVPVPRIPLVGSAALLVAAIAVGIAARVTHRRIHRARRLPEPSRAVALLVLGKTSLIAGTGFAAAYLTTALIYLPRLEAPLGRERLLGALMAAVAAAGLGAAGWFLERACQVPKDPDDSPGPAPGSRGEPG